MVSACAYSGAYPTGYGVHELSTEGDPAAAVRPARRVGVHPLPAVGHRRHPQVLQLPARHPDGRSARRPRHAVDAARRGGRTRLLHRHAEQRHPLRADGRTRRAPSIATRSRRTAMPGSSSTSRSAGSRSSTAARCRPGHASACIEPGVANGEIVVEGAPLAVHIECDTPDWRQMLWYDQRLMPGGTRLDFDSIRPTTLRPFGLMLRADRPSPAQTVELRIGFSLRGVEQARANLGRRLRSRPVQPSTRRRVATRATWSTHLDTIRVETTSSERRTVFSTALYHSLIKPCFAPNESPFWPASGPFVFDICTMWDIYRTQLPLITAARPRPGRRAGERAAADLRGGGQPADRLPDGAGRRPILAPGQRARPHLPRRRLRSSGRPSIDWDWALVHMHNDLRRNYGEEFLERGIAHPITHTLDLAFGYHCTAQVARRIGDDDLAEQFDALATRWVDAFDPDTGLLVDSTFYEGGQVELLVPPHPRHGRTYRARRRRGGRSRRSSTGSSASVPSPGEAARGRPRRRRRRRRVRARSVRGPQQRARHGGTVGLPLRRSSGSDRRDRPRRHRRTSSPPAVAGCPATTTRAA